MSDVEVMIENAARRLDRAVEARNKDLDALDKERFRVLPMRYVLEFPFKTFDSNEQLDISKTFVVREQSKHFACKRIVQSLIVVGTVGGDAARFTLAPILAERVVTFRFLLRDSYTDRAWSNVPLPGAVISQSYLQETLFARPARLPAGTQVEMNASILTASDALAGLIEIENFVLQISFVGDEVVRVAA